MKSATLSVLPDVSLVWKLGLSNFTVPYAIEEFIDNSFDARVPGTPPLVRVFARPGTGRISILDDSAGMTQEELQGALTIAAPKESSETIGIFGFGLKAAASYLARRMSVLTACEGSQEILYVNYDNESLKSWELPCFILPRPSTFPRGTRIVLTDLRVQIDDGVVGAVKKDVGVIYHRLIEAGKVRISINGEPVIPPKWVLMDDLRWDIDLNVNGKRVKGWLGAARPKGLGGTMNFTPGFYLVRKDRIVRQGEWIGIKEHGAVRTLVGELEMDEFPVNNNKTDFLRGTPDWVELGRQMELFLDAARKGGHTIRQQIYQGTTKRSKYVPIKLITQPVTPMPTTKPQGPHEGVVETPPQPPGMMTRTLPEATLVPTPAPSKKTLAEEILDRPREEIKKPVVFVVHGRDEEARAQCEDMLRSMGLEPIILRDKPAGGLISLLDKIEKYARESDYAVVLLTPDDFAWCPLAGETPEQATPRARQNVVFEFGYFVKWSRKRTVCLLKDGQNLVPPTDLNGIHYIPFKGKVSEVESLLRKELVEAGVLQVEQSS